MSGLYGAAAKEKVCGAVMAGKKGGQKKQSDEMTNAKKKYLAQYIEKGREIDELCEQLAGWRCMATKVNASISDMPRGNRSENRQQNAVEHIIETEAKINAEIDKYIKLREEILHAIETVGDSTLKLILKYRYIHGLKWEDIAIKMNYEYRWLLRLYNRAMGELTIKNQY